MYAVKCNSIFLNLVLGYKLTCEIECYFFFEINIFTCFVLLSLFNIKSFEKCFYFSFNLSLYYIIINTTLKSLREI